VRLNNSVLFLNLSNFSLDKIFIGVSLSLSSEKLHYFNGSTYESIITIENNRWYLIKVNFECINRHYSILGKNQWRITNNVYGIYNFWNDVTFINYIELFSSNFDFEWNVKITGFNFSWDLRFKIEHYLLKYLKVNVYLELKNIPFLILSKEPTFFRIGAEKYFDIYSVLIPNFYKNNFSSIFTIAEKNVKIQLRFKFNLVYSIISPFLPISMSLIVLLRFFVADVTSGQWDGTNYLIFLFTAFNIELLRRIIQDFPDDFRLEKYWKTLPALMIAPFNKLHLLFGIFLSHLIIIAIPFVVFFLLTYMKSPISIFTIVFIIIIYLLIDLIFSGIGLFLAVFAISKENY